jgi:hypothetical protein
MSRKSSISRALLAIALVLTLLPALAIAAPAGKRHPVRWHGYGFLPGYQQPPSNSAPPTLREAERGPPGYKRRHWYIDPTPEYFGYDGEWHYFGRPGFYRGHYNGGSFGPCWTRTPIGPVWNCG